jgi:hypothetical protein
MQKPTPRAPPRAPPMPPNVTNMRANRAQVKP